MEIEELNIEIQKMLNDDVTVRRLGDNMEFYLEDTQIFVLFIDRFEIIFKGETINFYTLGAVETLKKLNRIINVCLLLQDESILKKIKDLIKAFIK